MKIIKKETYRGRTTPAIEWLLLDTNNKLVQSFNTKKQAKEMLDIYTLPKHEVFEKYPHLKP